LLLKSRYFNLVDVIDAHRRGKDETVQIFASAEALEEHTKKTAAFFPRYHVAAAGLLKRVLRRIPGTECMDVKTRERSGPGTTAVNDIRNKSI
jgi:hypothetical protein